MKTRKDIIRPIRAMVRAQCATFSVESNGCGNACHFGPGDQAKCVFFRDDGQYPEFLKKGIVRCSYFETHVLPADPALEVAYWGKHPGSEQAQAVAICGRCGSSFVKRSNRHTYCTACRELQTRKANRDRQRKKYWEDKTQNLTV